MPTNMDIKFSLKNNVKYFVIFLYHRYLGKILWVISLVEVLYT